jgi:hypothetical protein
MVVAWLAVTVNGMVFPSKSICPLVFSVEEIYSAILELVLSICAGYAIQNSFPLLEKSCAINKDIGTKNSNSSKLHFFISSGGFLKSSIG